MGRIRARRLESDAAAGSRGNGNRAVPRSDWGKASDRKPLKGIVKGAGVLEVVEDYDKDTFRTVYTVKFTEAIYVLHVFQKKSKRGTETPRHEVELIRARYEQAREQHQAEFGSKGDRR